MTLQIRSEKKTSIGTRLQVWQEQGIGTRLQVMAKIGDWESEPV